MKKNKKFLNWNKKLILSIQNIKDKLNKLIFKISAK